MRAQAESQPSFPSITTVNFDPVTTINSGQTFLWEKIGNSWYGIHGKNILKFAVVTAGNESGLDFSSFPEFKGWEDRIFRLTDNLRKIQSEISRDDLMSDLVSKYPGLRIMRQDAEQCLFSFICASNTTIPMIRRMLKALSKKFGTRVVFDGNEFFTFPDANALGRAEVDDLRSCGLGFRAKAVSAAAKKIVSGDLDLDFLKSRPYDEAKKELMQLYGIGNKIADCILLFSLEKINSFPIDVWIARALSKHYSWMYGIKFSEKITVNQYTKISEKTRDYFGSYCGYAQQYLYFHMRQSAGKKW